MNIKIVVFKLSIINFRGTQMELYKVRRIVHDRSREEMWIPRHLYLLHHLYLPLLLHHVEHCCCRYHWQFWLSHSRLFHPRLPSLVRVCHHLVWIWSRRRVSASHFSQVEKYFRPDKTKNIWMVDGLWSLKYFLTWKYDLWWGWRKQTKVGYFKSILLVRTREQQHKRNSGLK